MQFLFSIALWIFGPNRGANKHKTNAVRRRDPMTACAAAIIDSRVVGLLSFIRSFYRFLLCRQEKFHLPTPFNSRACGMTNFFTPIET